MADIIISEGDEQLMREILLKGFGVKSLGKWPKYIPMRLALNISLNIDAKPSDSYDNFDKSGGGEIALAQLRIF